MSHNEPIEMFVSEGQNRVLQGLALGHRAGRCGEVGGLEAQVVCGHLEGHARSSGVLEEEHPEHAVFERVNRLSGDDPGLVLLPSRQQLFDLRLLQVTDPQQMLAHHLRTASPAFSTTTTSSPSYSLTRTITW